MESKKVFRKTPENNDPTKPNGEYKLYRNDVLISFKDEYRLHTKLGSGTFGQVVKCLTKCSNEFVAVKILKNNPAYDDDVENEIDMLEEILKYTPEKFNFVRKLDCFLHKAKAVGYILHQLLTGLVRLKQLGIVHTDIKTQNIMLVNSKQLPYRIKLIDFGSAVKINKAVQGDYITSRNYRSPEIILGAPFTEKIDMWSLGCIAVELLINRILYLAPSEYDHIRCICEMQGLPPNSILDNGLNTSMYFNLTTDGYQLKACETLDTKNIEPKITCLQNMVSFNMRSNLKGEKLMKEMLARSGITTLIEKMLEVDPEKRITPEEGLTHSAVCDSWTGFQRRRVSEKPN